MSGSRRTPINRMPRPVLDAETVQLFRRCVTLQSEGREGELRKIALVLHRRLALRPWQESVLDVDDEPPDNPHHIRDWKVVMALRQQLRAAAFGGGKDLP